MGDKTKIEWCDHTFNPWVGCTKVSLACDFCYAEGWAKRTGHPQLWQGERRRTAYWREPLRWDRKAVAAGKRARVFCASLADVFDNQVPDEWRSDLWELIASTPHLNWLLLTKRPQNITKMLPRSCAVQTAGHDWPWPNVWLGTTAENQEQADRRIPILLATPAAVRFVSLEPLLGPIDLTTLRGPPIDFEDAPKRAHWINALTGEHGTWLAPGWKCVEQAKMGRLDQVIVGGESGPKARPLRIEWVRSLRDQCGSAPTAFFFKQWGEYAPDDPAADRTAMIRVGKRAAGRLLDGVEHNGMPR